MNEHTVAGRMRPIPLFIACTFALAACGGGGGGGGSTQSRLSGEESAALAAVSAASMAGFARSMAEDQVEDPEGESASGASFAGASTVVGCSPPGSIRIRDENDAKIDIEDADFPDAFSNPDTMPPRLR